jgi:hypothetical protein
MYSNYNVLTLPIECDGKYKIGDIYNYTNKLNWRIHRFNGLEIKSIDYCFGVRLHFDWNEWENNINNNYGR